MENNATTVADLITTIGTQTQTIAGDAMSGIGTIIPYALPVFGAIIVVFLLIKVIKRIMNK